MSSPRSPPKDALPRGLRWLENQVRAPVAEFKASGGREGKVTRISDALKAPPPSFALAAAEHGGLFRRAACLDAADPDQFLRDCEVLLQGDISPLAARAKSDA
eukprot:3329969-Pyramimonas_sp.AAC.1